MIRTALILSFACLLGLFIQATFIHSSFPSAPAPDFILALVVLLALQKRSVSAVFLAFFLGLLADFASGQFVGPNAAGMVIAFAIVGLISSRVYAERFLAVAMIAFLCSLAKSCTYSILLAVYVGADIFASEVLAIILFEAGLTAVAAPLLLAILTWGRSPRRSGATATGSFRWSAEAR